MQHLIKPALFISYFLFAILLNSVGTLILQAQLEYGIGQAQAAILEAFKDISIAIASFFATSVVIWLGKRQALQIGILAITAITLVLPTILSFNTMKLLLAITGASFALTKIIVFSMLGKLYTDKKAHASAMISLEAFFMVGVLFGYWLFGHFLGLQNLHWSTSFYLICVLSIVSLALSFSLPKDKVPQEQSTTAHIDLIKLAVKPLFLVFIAAVFFYVLIEQSIMSWLPSFNKTVLNLSTSLAVQMGMILAAATALGRITGAIAVRYMHWFTLVKISTLCAAFLVISAIAITPEPPAEALSSWLSAPLVAYLFPCIGFFLAPIYPALNSTLLTATPVSEHTKIASLIVLFSALGGTTGSALTGKLFELVGGASAFYFSLIPLTLLLVSTYIFHKKAQ